MSSKDNPKIVDERSKRKTLCSQRISSMRNDRIDDATVASHEVESHSRQNNSTLIIGLMLVSVLAVSGCLNGNLDLTKNIEEESECLSKLQEIEDIISVSAGGFLSSDLCIFIVNGRKVSGEGEVCVSQIGDKVYMSDYGLMPEWVCR